MIDLTTHVVGGDELGDVEALFEQSRVLSGCWCMWPYSTRGNFEPSDRNRLAMAQLVSEDRRPGVLARLDDAPIGWCALGPISNYPRYGTLSSEPYAWAVACIYVAPAGRGRGVTKALLDRAVELATEGGAAVLYGPPPWWDAGGSEACAVASAALQEHGFVMVASGPRMPILRRDLDP